RLATELDRADELASREVDVVESQGRLAPDQVTATLEPGQTAHEAGLARDRHRCQLGGRGAVPAYEPAAVRVSVDEELAVLVQVMVRDGNARHAQDELGALPLREQHDRVGRTWDDARRDRGRSRRVTTRDAEACCNAPDPRFQGSAAHLARIEDPPQAEQ